MGNKWDCNTLDISHMVSLILVAEVMLTLTNVGSR